MDPTRRTPAQLVANAEHEGAHPELARWRSDLRRLGPATAVLELHPKTGPGWRFGPVSRDHLRIEPVIHDTPPSRESYHQNSLLSNPQWIGRTDQRKSRIAAITSAWRSRKQ
jgi:hypothetical protein